MVFLVAPVVKVLTGALMVGGIFAASDLMQETGDTITAAGDTAQKSEDFLERVIALVAVAGSFYLLSKVI